MSDTNNSTPSTPTSPTNTANDSAQGNAPAAVEEAVSNLEEQAADPSLSKEEKKEIKKQISKLKLKIDGAEVEETLPFEIPDDPKAVEYMKKQLQMAKMGNKRAQYAKTLETDIKDFFENLRKNPRGVLSDPTIGLDLKELASQILNEEIENSKKTPEQIEREKLENELKKLKEERETEKKEAQEKAFETQTKQAYQEYEQGIIRAIDESKDLPKSAYVIKKFADFLLTGIEAGIPLSPSDVVELVREDLRNDMKSMFDASPDEMVESFLGKERLTKMRRKTVEKAKEVNPLSTVKDVGKTLIKPKEEKKVNYRDFFKSLK